MLILNCPNCGPRNVAEFRFGGEVNPRPADPAALSDAEWSEFLFMRQNALGLEMEWWYHRSGCGLWFLAERHTLTNQVTRTFRWPPAARPASHEEAGHGR